MNEEKKTMTSQEREDNFQTLYSLYLTEAEIEKKLVAKDNLTVHRLSLLVYYLKNTENGVYSINEEAEYLLAFKKSLNKLADFINYREDGILKKYNDTISKKISEEHKMREKYQDFEDVEKEAIEAVAKKMKETHIHPIYIFCPWEDEQHIKFIYDDYFAIAEQRREKERISLSDDDLPF